MSQTKQKILIVEDDEMIAAIYKRQLEKENYEVSLIKEGQAAIEAVKKDAPNLILLDMVMPGMDGIEILKAIRVVNKESQVIVFSNVQEKGKEEEAMNAGANAFLIKAHHTPSQLAEKVKALLG